LCQSEVAPNHPSHATYTGGSYIAMMIRQGGSKWRNDHAEPTAETCPCGVVWRRHCLIRKRFVGPALARRCIFAFATKPFPIVCRARAVGKMSGSCADFTRRSVWLGRESYRWFPPRRLTQSASPSNPPLVAEKSRKNRTRKVRAAALRLV